MLVSFALSTCIAAAAARYEVPSRLLEALVVDAAAHPVAGRVGAAGVPVEWLPYLGQAGLDPAAVVADPCVSVVAAGWILGLTRRVNEVMGARGAGPGVVGAKLPARIKPWLPWIRWVCAQAGVSEALVLAVMERESGFKPGALGPRTRSGERAVGLMQLAPSTARRLGVDPGDTAQNVWGGVWYLANLIRAYHGNSALALAAYNAGPGAVQRYGTIPPYAETQKYVPAVLGREAALVGDCARGNCER